MKNHWLHITSAICAIIVFPSLSAMQTASAVAQDATPAAISANQPPQTTAASEGALEQLVAPVALYSDPLLADILTAATYPLEIVEAQRWLVANPGLKGDSLTQALAGENWDPSVEALVPFPAVLKMMDDNIDWTERLGEAFLAQQGAVMDAVQQLRHRAQTAGTLKTTPQEVVGSDGDAVTIQPPPSEVVYVPAYDPWCVYGGWPYPAYPPYAFAPWPAACMPADYVIGFDAGLFLPFAFWDWGYFDWYNHGIRIDQGRYQQFGHASPGDRWHHDPAHRRDVPYSNPRNQQQFQPGRDTSIARGFEGRIGEPSAHTAPAFESFGSGRDVRMQSERGQNSLRSMSGFSRGFGGGIPHGGGFGGGMPHGGGAGGFGGRR